MSHLARILTLEQAKKVTAAEVNYGFLVVLIARSHFRNLTHGDPVLY